jgi:hypothetical protein
LILELIAVFIGVSAGFFFDNFREDRSDRKLEDKYLTSLYDNLLADSLEIHRMMDNNRNNIDISRRSVASMQSGTFSLDSALALFSIMATFNNLNLEDATYESIVNSGNLGLISDYDLREKIVYYYRSHDNVRYVENLLSDYITDFIIPYGMKNLDFLTGTFMEEFSPEDVVFRNITSAYNVLVYQQMEIVQELDSMNTSLKNQLAAGH